MSCKLNHEGVNWIARARIERFASDIDEYRALFGKEEGERRFFAENMPVSSEEVDGNLLMTAGANLLWTALVSATNVTPFSNANAAIGVGDSSTAELASQTNLQASTNAFRVVMDATYPIVSTNQVQFKATFGTSVGNFAWNEWGVFSGVGTGSPPTGGTMLNRKVTSLGTKTSAGSWALTVTLSLA